MIPRETLPRFGVPRREMMKRVSRFRELKGSDDGLLTASEIMRLRIPQVAAEA